LIVDISTILVPFFSLPLHLGEGQSRIAGWDEVCYNSYYMEPEEREMLKKTLELAQENNKMLHRIRRGMFWGRIMRVVYWIIIIGVAIGVYY
jgi:hypothetical protein